MGATKLQNRRSTKPVQGACGDGTNVAPTPWRAATRHDLVCALRKVLTSSHVAKAYDGDRGGVVAQLADDELHRARIEGARGPACFDRKTLEYELYRIVVDLRTLEVLS